MQFWLDIADFAVKALLIVIAIGAVAFVIARASRGEREPGPGLAVDLLNDRYRDDKATLEDELLDKAGRKAARKGAKKAAKAPPPDARIFVLGFKGDMTASAVKRLGREIDAVLSVARAKTDEVVLRLESPGGTVTGYGLAAAQLQRLRAAGVRLTASVDQVAASGGYMMACVADHIVAAPFAMVGSIGVVAQVPNLNRLLKKNAIDYEEITAGEHKRSISILGEITPAGREHFRGKLDSTHVAFKAFVKANRAALDIDAVGDGDVWLGTEAVKLGLVDEIATGDEYLFRRRESARLFAVSLRERRGWMRLLGRAEARVWDVMARIGLGRL